MDQNPTTYLLWFLIATGALGCALQLRQVITSFRRYRLAKKLKSEQDQLPSQVYTVQPNGWVHVNKEALLFPADRPADETNVFEVESSDAFELMLGNLTRRYMHDVIRTAKSVEQSTQDKLNDDTLRGMTVGSAFFNYSIPESFVLLDHRTRLLAARFLRNDKERYEVYKWLELKEHAFGSRYTLLTAFEKSQRQGTGKDALLDFYHRYYPLIVNAVLQQSQQEHYPHITSFADQLLRQAKLPNKDSIHSHHMRAAISVMVGILELKVPSCWVYPSEAVTEVVEILLGTEPKRPTLSLVK
jgi:hypothetical protein